MRLGDVADDREAEAGAGHAARGRCAVEALEDERKVCLVDPGAVVADGRRCVPATVTSTTPPGGLHFAALARMFATARWSRSASPSTDDGCARQLEADPGRVASHALDLARHERVEADVLEPGLGVAVQRELDHVGDEAVELVHLVDDRARDASCSSSRTLAALEQLGVRADARQRRAELVRRVGDELSLRARASARARRASR